MVRETTGDSQAKFAQKLGMKQQTYANYELSGKIIPDALKTQLRAEMDIDLNWLVTGEGEMFNSGSTSGKFSRSSNLGEPPSTPDPPALQKGVEFIPMTDLKLSAGPGEEWGSGAETGELLAVPRKIFDRYRSLCSTFGAATVSGDSMEPTLKNGEPVVFASGLIDTDGIYVIAIHGELFVKRLSLDLLDNQVTIISDNQFYPEKTYPIDREGLRILGKVVFWIHMEN